MGRIESDGGTRWDENRTEEMGRLAAEGGRSIPINGGLNYPNGGLEAEVDLLPVEFRLDLFRWGFRVKLSRRRCFFVSQ